MSTGATILVIGYGNPGRRDDGLGPLVAEAVEAARIPGVETLTDYQLNVEHAADIAAARTVIFADAAVGAPDPYFFRRLMPRRAEGFSTHSMRPEAVLAFAEDTFGWSGDAFLLGVQGRDFSDFGEQISDTASENLAQASELLIGALRAARLNESTTDAPTDNSVTHCYGEKRCKTAST